MDFRTQEVGEAFERIFRGSIAVAGFRGLVRFHKGSWGFGKRASWAGYPGLGHGPLTIFLLGPTSSG